VDKVFVAKRVAAKLRSAEHSIDAALVEASELVAEIVRGRKELNLGAKVVDPAFAKVAAAIAALTEARSATVGAHDELAEVQLRLGIRTRMDGGENKVEEARQSSERDAA
jgi:hypothetical protein